MEKVSANDPLEQLMADEDLMKLCELLRTGDEVLDVISLSENQHSDILGWLIDPCEGHGQGDQILRDFLIAASIKATSGEIGLNRRGSTYRFFKKWPPSRIRTTGFGSVFCARELGMKSSERVDIFVIDPQNKFIVLIENKAGAGHHKEQLEQYFNSFHETVDKNNHLRKYDHVFIAIDREFEDVDDYHELPCSDVWLHIGYDWLKTSARRALLHVERGNAAAKLVVNYCTRQSEWESPQTKECLELATVLHQKHPEAVLRLVQPSSGRIEKEWLNADCPENSLLFLLQNKSVVELLRDTKGMVSVKAALHKNIPEIQISNIEHARAWLNVCPRGWNNFKGVQWPLVINVRFSDQTKAKFDVRLVWRSDMVSDDYNPQDLRNQLAKIYSKFGSFGDSSVRRISVVKNLSLNDLMEKIKGLNDELGGLLD